MWSCVSSLPGSLPASAPQCFCSPRGSFYSITGRKGNSFKCLDFPVQEKAKQKKVCSELQHSGHPLLPPPHTQRPHTRTSRRAHLLPAQRRLPIPSQGWLSFKGKSPKRNPASSVAQPLLRHGAGLCCAGEALLWGKLS